MNIRKTKKKDLPAIRKLNETAVPHVNNITLEDFEWFLQESRFFKTLELDNHIAGFLIVLGPGLDYQSPNYSYFSSNYEDFDYVDRIVIGEEFQGKKAGSKLYTYLFEQSEAAVIACEVNLKPPNPVSLSFHQKMGFKEVGQQDTCGGKKKVSLLVRKL